MAVMVRSLFAWHGTALELTEWKMVAVELAADNKGSSLLTVGQTMPISTKQGAYFGQSNKNMAENFLGLI